MELLTYDRTSLCSLDDSALSLTTVTKTHSVGYASPEERGNCPLDLPPTGHKCQETSPLLILPAAVECDQVHGRKQLLSTCRRALAKPTVVHASRYRYECCASRWLPHLPL
jgi:hypothetical protein